MKGLLLTSILLSSLAWGKTYQFSSFEEASKSPEYIKLVGKSKKLGLIETSFEGYAKSFKINFIKEANHLMGVEVSIDTNSLDTDNGGRNKKMHQTTLSVEQFPLITFDSKQIIDLALSNASLLGTLKVRDTKKKVKLNYAIIKLPKGGYEIQGSLALSLKEFNIPDPSIFIAKVNDQIDLEFKVQINESP